MSTLFTRHSPGALTLREAVELEKKRAAAERKRRKQQAEAEALAREGRGGDTEIAHVARGEMVIPRALQTPELMTAVSRAAARYRAPMQMLFVGNAMNRINPNTGIPEFDPDWWDNFKDRLNGMFGADVPQNTSPTQEPAGMIPQPEINHFPIVPSDQNLNFDPKGPGLLRTELQHPFDAWQANSAGEQAREEAIKKYGEGNVKDLVDGPGDAWRHARWNQLMTQSIGADRAKAFSDAYEITHWDDDTDGARGMDLYNNQAGRSLPANGDPNEVLQNALMSGYLRTRPFGR